jgi:cell division protein FtsA
MENEVFVGLDIGTTKVACIIAEPGENDALKLVGVGTSPSDGLRKGVVVDIGKTVRSIKKAVEEAELMAGVDVDSVWVGVAGDHIRAHNSTGFVAITHENREHRENREIMQVDMDRAIDVARAVPIPQDYEVLHVIPQEYCVDDQRGIKNPLGMCGVRLATQVHIITGQATRIQDITKCVEKAELKLNKLVLEPLASSYAVLEKDEKERGVALIDIGGGTTDIAIYFDGNIRHTAIVGLGGKNVTKDIAIVQKTPEEKAEEIKRKYGCAYQPLLRGNERLIVPATGGREDREIERKWLVDVIEPRVEEILSLAMREIKKTEYMEMLGAGVVLTGGGAMLEGMREKAENIFQTPVKIGVPTRFGGLSDVAKSPAYATSVGLCMYAAEEYAENTKGKKRSGGDGGFRQAIDNAVSWIKKYF